jgi:hypothetical protein
VLVLVGQAQRQRLRDGLGGRGGRLQLELLPAGEPLALLRLRAVDTDVAALEQPFGGRAGADLVEAGEEAVEPLPGRLVRNA